MKGAPGRFCENTFATNLRPQLVRLRLRLRLLARVHDLRLALEASRLLPAPRAMNHKSGGAEHPRPNTATRC
eukprot:4158274-Alexandrium_andersonii.AAC.1